MSWRSCCHLYDIMFCGSVYDRGGDCGCCRTGSSLIAPTRPIMSRCWCTCRSSGGSICIKSFLDCAWVCCRRIRVGACCKFLPLPRGKEAALRIGSPPESASGWPGNVVTDSRDAGRRLRSCEDRSARGLDELAVDGSCSYAASRVTFFLQHRDAKQPHLNKRRKPSYQAVRLSGSGAGRCSRATIVCTIHKAQAARISKPQDQQLEPSHGWTRLTNR